MENLNICLDFFLNIKFVLYLALTIMQFQTKKNFDFFNLHIDGQETNDFELLNWSFETI